MGIKKLNDGSFLETNTLAKRTIESEHAQIWDGMSFTILYKIASIANGANFDVLFVVPSDLDYIHLTYFAFDINGAPADVFLYEDVVATGSTALTAININRLSLKSAKVQTSHSPSVTSLGTELVYDLITGTKQSGGSSSNVIDHFVLKPNTKYLLRLTNNSNGTQIAHLHLQWYECYDSLIKERQSV